LAPFSYLRCTPRSLRLGCVRRQAAGPSSHPDPQAPLLPCRLGPAAYSDDGAEQLCTRTTRRMAPHRQPRWGMPRLGKRNYAGARPPLSVALFYAWIYCRGFKRAGELSGTRADEMPSGACLDPSGGITLNSHHHRNPTQPPHHVAAPDTDTSLRNAQAAQYVAGDATAVAV
jgi:hypothetical protein